ncbi:MAG: hypothetical protein JNM51_07800, partial [Bacteroidia bacterium]|nr:hypothetical protein [Bacteroidia bacterium]
NSAEELKVSLYPSSLYKEFFDENIHEIFGKIKINDSICGIVYLIPGDILFPILITYNEQGKKIDTLEMVHLPGGSDGYNANGSSYLVMNENLEIQITDTINTFERDSLTKIIESTRETKVVIEKYRVNYIGKIIAHD